MEYTEAALAILKESDKPLSAIEIWKKIKELNLIDAKNAKTPERTLNSYLHWNSDSNENESSLFSITSKKPDKFILIDKLDSWMEKQNNIQKKLYISNEVKYQVIKDIYTKTGAFNKSSTDNRILIFNDRFKRLVSRHKTIGERVRNLKETFELVKSYIGVSNVEKKLKGEVFTPFDLIEDMLNSKSKEFWEDLDKKILEPANGIGNFIVVLVFRYMYGFKHPDGWETKGLSEKILDEEERYAWIMQEIIHVCDIQSKNMFIYREIFDPEHKLNLKYFTGSYLTEEFDKKSEEWKSQSTNWTSQKFEVVSNPPYQELDNNDRSKGGGKGGDNNLWSKFITKSIKISDSILFINPPSFFSPDHKISKSLFESGGFRKLKIFEKSPFEYASTNACHYLWEKDYFGETIINNGTINLHDMKIYPSSSDIVDFNIFNKFFNNSECFNFVSNSKLHKTNKKEYISDKQDNIFKYKLYHASKIIFSSIKTEDFDNYKVMLSDSGYLNPQFDNNCNTSQHTFYLNVDNEFIAKRVIEILNSKPYKYVLNKTKFSGFYHGTVLKNIPKVDLSKSWTDEELYKYFNLTKEEIQKIEDTVK